MSSVLNFVSTSGLSYNKTSFEKSKWLYCIFTLYELYNSMGVHSNCLNNKRLPRSIFSVLRSIAQPWHLKWKKNSSLPYLCYTILRMWFKSQRVFYGFKRNVCVGIKLNGNKNKNHMTRFKCTIRNSNGWILIFNFFMFKYEIHMDFDSKKEIMFFAVVWRKPQNICLITMAPLALIGLSHSIIVKLNKTQRKIKIKAIT